eukprot:g6973.t1
MTRTYGELVNQPGKYLVRISLEASYQQSLVREYTRYVELEQSGYGDIKLEWDDALIAEVSQLGVKENKLDIEKIVYRERGETVFQHFRAMMPEMKKKLMEHWVPKLVPMENFVLDDERDMLSNEKHGSARFLKPWLMEIYDEYFASKLHAYLLKRFRYKWLLNFPGPTGKVPNEWRQMWNYWRHYKLKEFTWKKNSDDWKLYLVPGASYVSNCKPDLRFSCEFDKHGQLELYQVNSTERKTILQCNEVEIKLEKTGNSVHDDTGGLAYCQYHERKFLDEVLKNELVDLSMCEYECVVDIQRKLGIKDLEIADLKGSHKSLPPELDDCIKFTGKKRDPEATASMKANYAKSVYNVELKCEDEVRYFVAHRFTGKRFRKSEYWRTHVFSQYMRSKFFETFLCDNRNVAVGSNQAIDKLKNNDVVFMRRIEKKFAKTVIWLKKRFEMKVGYDNDRKRRRNDETTTVQYDNNGKTKENDNTTKRPHKKRKC